LATLQGRQPIIIEWCWDTRPSDGTQSWHLSASWRRWRGFTAGLWHQFDCAGRWAMCASQRWLARPTRLPSAATYGYDSVASQVE